MDGLLNTTLSRYLMVMFSEVLPKYTPYLTHEGEIWGVFWELTVLSKFYLSYSNQYRVILDHDISRVNRITFLYLTLLMLL